MNSTIKKLSDVARRVFGRGLAKRRPVLLRSNVNDPNWSSLLTKAMGDKAMVERLIAYESRRTPGIARDEAIRRAKDRWERDLVR